MQRPSAILALYLWLTSIGDGWAERKLARRLAEGKEDPERIKERTGHASQPRPDGPLVWFHAASVGESLSLIELLRRIRSERPTLNILVTTGTRTSAALMRTRLPEGAIHQFAPIDTKTSVKRFLEHWSPDLAIWTESEFWPRTLTMTHRAKIPMALINGRISERSVRNWRWIKTMARRLLGYFDLMMMQDDSGREALLALGAVPERVHVTGSLKEGSVPLEDDPKERALFAKAAGTRPVWLAASTHESEEEIIADAHKRVARKNPGLLLVLAPRHPERSDDVAAGLRAKGLQLAQRSKGENVEEQTDVYLADTLGELGIWYRVCPVSFVGGSLAPIGGHNPFEPAALGSAILYGPHVENFADIYARLHAKKAAVEVEDVETLAAAVNYALQPHIAASLAAAAWEVSSEGADVTEHVLEHLSPLLDRAGGA
jgi:3-deoxy-D-manno-octulosonic-acid transferase